jgi:uncharacterized protein (TIGR02268 family)
MTSAMLCPQFFWIQVSALLSLWSLPALAEAPVDAMSRPRGGPVRRVLHLSMSPSSEAPEVYVTAQGVTTLRFETPCDPSRTSLLGWEGRFEPVACWGRAVSLVPLKELVVADRLLLRVTLMDGRELPFTVTTAGDAWDAQIDVYPDPDSPESVRVALKEAREHNLALEEDNQRQRREASSVDHALAALLARDEVPLTPFRAVDATSLKEGGLEINIATFVSKKQTMDKVAVVFTVKNTDRDRPWTRMQARFEAIKTQEERPVALRAVPESIEPGETSRVAVVADLSWFNLKKHGDRLAVTLFRDDGRGLAHIVLNASALPR